MSQDPTRVDRCTRCRPSTRLWRFSPPTVGRWVHRRRPEADRPPPRRARRDDRIRPATVVGFRPCPRNDWFPSRLPSVWPQTTWPGTPSVRCVGASTPTRSEPISSRWRPDCGRWPSGNRSCSRSWTMPSAGPNNPVLDEPTLTAALGTETARVLHSAHEASAEMVAKAEAESSRLMTEAREEIEQIRANTEARLEERTAAAEAAMAELRDRTNQQVACGAGGGPAARPSSCWIRPDNSAGRWWTRHRACGRGSCPIWPNGARCSTPRSSSSGPVGNAWPRRSTMSAGRST